MSFQPGDCGVRNLPSKQTPQSSDLIFQIDDFLQGIPTGSKELCLHKHSKMKPSSVLPGLWLAVVIAGSVHAQPGSNNSISNKQKEGKMAQTNSNKNIILKLYNEALNKRDKELTKALVGEEFIGPRGLKGAAGFWAPLQPLLEAFPDMQWTVEEMLEEEGKVTVRFTTHGTHTGIFNGLPATGKKVTGNGIGFFQLKEGRVISGQVYTDRLGFLQELGVLPLDINVLYAGKAPKGAVQFIDKFIVPAAAKQEFLERVTINRSFIKTLPGFVEDAAYERADGQGNLVFITVAVWLSEEAVQKAKEAVQAEYKKQGFDMPGMLKRLGIAMERGIYKAAGL